MTKSLTYIEIDIPSFVLESPEAIQTWRFAMPADYLPSEIDAIPSIDSVSFTPARISLGRDLGERASLNISLRDHKHIFNGEPFDQGTFFGKWRGRYGTKLRGRELRLIRGQVGQTIEQMDIRYYVIEDTDGPDFNGVYTIEAKDILKLADDDRAQAPRLSNGSLVAPIDNAAGSLTLNPVGIGNLEYPASGWVCLGGKEVVEFTRSADVLTITRGQFGTIAQAHDAGDRVQLVLRYAGDDAADIIADLMENYAGVPGAYIPLAEWEDETAAFLGVLYARTITEPTSVRKLISELIEQASLAVWWDDRTRLVRLNVMREISTDTDFFGHERILEGSFKVKEQPGKRISQIWTYYGQRDPTDTSANEDNYRAVLADVDLDRETEYGSAEIVKIQGQWVETEVAATRLNSIQLSRFRDPPRSFAFEVFRDVAIIPAAGYQLQWWGSQDETGVEQPVKVQITHVRLEPDRVYVEAEEMLASGAIVLSHTIFLLNAGVLSDFEVPAGWNDADNAIHVIAGGASGHGTTSGNDGRGGGGGGAYSRVNNVSLTPLAMVPYFVGRGGLGTVNGAGQDGEDTWFGHATYASSIVAARRGQGGSGRDGGQGGQASEGIGDVRFSGGNGGNGGNSSGSNRSGGGAGGGAGGPNGHGANGGSSSGGTTGGRGGGGGGAGNGGSQGASVSSPYGGNGGNNRNGFGGGNDSQPTGQESGGGRGSDTAGQPNFGGDGGNGEQLWTQTVAPIISAGPGGGGGGGGTGRSGRDGGLYGGGGGGVGRHTGAQRSGSGRQGVIVLTWRDAVGSP